MAQLTDRQKLRRQLVVDRPDNQYEIRKDVLSLEDGDRPLDYERYVRQCRRRNVMPLPRGRRFKKIHL